MADHSASPRSHALQILRERGSVPDEPEAPTGPCACVESIWFQFLVGIVIVCNAATIGVELELSTESSPSSSESLFLAFFTAELIMRRCHHGSGFFASCGNWFDTLLVSCGVFDLWVAPALRWFLGTRSNDHDLLSLLAQSFRLLRIIRLLRLVKILQPLNRLALDIAEAVQGMLWVLVFLAMSLYAAAVLCSRMLGQAERSGLNVENEEPEAAEIRMMFDGVLESMFVLFEMMSCWSLMRFAPLFEFLPLLRLLAVFFYMLMAWVLLAVLTAVVSGKLLSVRDRLNQAENDREKAKTAFVAEKLLELFRKVDKDGSGTINREEFSTVLLNADLSKIVLDYTQVSLEDLNAMFDWLDRDRNGDITIQEFLAGFYWLNNDVSPKTMLKLEQDTSRDVRKLEKRLVAFIDEKFDELISGLSTPLRKINAVAEQTKRLEAAIQKSQADLPPIPVDHEAGQALASLEDRVSMRISSLFSALDRLASEDGVY